MSRYDNYEAHLNALSQTPAEQDFLNQTDRAIETLMPLGQTDINHVASLLCMHASKFRRKMKDATGLPPSAYIATLRMRRAVSLLQQHPEQTIAHIASCCGFADHAHFTHAFRRLMDATPLSYANRSKEANVPQ